MTRDDPKLPLAEEPVENIESLHRSLVENLEVVLFRTNANGQWTALSQGWARITGHAVSTSIGVSARQFVHASDVARYAALSQNMLQDPGQYFRQTLRIVRADGQMGWIEVYAAMLSDANGAPAGTCGYLCDVSPGSEKRFRRRAMRAIPDAHREAMDRVHGTTGMIATTAARPLHILLVEDQPVTQKLMQLLLEKWGHQVVIAGDGRAGLESFLQHPFDLVLMDLQLPLMDGLNVTVAIREYENQGGLGRTPVLAMTAQTGPGDREICLAAGMDNYLPKPIMARALQEMLQTYGAARHQVVR